MLSPSERALVAQDRELPELATMLDADLFCEAVRPCFPGVEISHAQRSYIRYKPGVSCLVAYSLETSSGESTLYARTHSAGSKKKIDKAGSGAQRIGSGDLTAIYRFPEDRRIRLLSQLGEKRDRIALLSRVLPESLDPERCDVETIHYKPERRWVGAILIDGKPRAALKLYAAQESRALQIGGRAFQSGTRLVVPRPIAKRDAPRGTSASEWFDGQLLSEELAANPAGAGADEVTRVGAALAELHAQRPERLLYRSVDQELTGLDAVVEQACQLAPELAARTSALLDRIAASRRRSNAEHAPIHGDFYAKQVLLAPDSICILDLDHAVRAPLAADLGLFAAHLWLDVARGRLPEPRAGELTNALVEGYGGVDTAELDVHTSAGLVSLLHHPFRHCDPEWRSRMERLVEFAETLGPKEDVAARSAPTPRTGRDKVLVEDPYGVVEDKAMPYLRDALSPQLAAKALQEEVFFETPFRLRSIRVTRHKPGRRCIVEYDVDVQDPDGSRRRRRLIGKSRARGLDKVTFEVSRALIKGGLGPDSQHGVSTSRPLGTIAGWNMWLQEGVNGIESTRLLYGPDGPALARRIAEALCWLHDVAVPCSRRHTLEDEIRLLRGRLERLPEAWSPRLRAVLEACERDASALPVVPALGIHRDFYPEQVIVEGDRIHIIDLDLYCLGDPALDAGNFVGHLMEYALRERGGADGLEAVTSAFEERFIQLAGEQHRPAFPIYTTLCLVRHIHLSTRFENRRAFSERILELCEERLGLPC